MCIREMVIMGWNWLSECDQKIQRLRVNNL